VKFLQSLYWNQYYELKQKGKEQAARKNGTVLSTVAIMANSSVLLGFLIFFFPDIGDGIMDLLEDAFGPRGGRTMGQILGAILFASIYFVIHFTLGKPEKFDRMMESFLSLSEEEQLIASKQGLRYFMISLLLVALPLLQLVFS